MMTNDVPWQKKSQCATRFEVTHISTHVTDVVPSFGILGLMEIPNVVVRNT